MTNCSTWKWNAFSLDRKAFFVNVNLDAFYRVTFNISLWQETVKRSLIDVRCFYYSLSFSLSLSLSLWIFIPLCGQVGEPVINLSKNKTKHSPSTKDVKSVTLAAFLLPAGRFRPIFSSFSLSRRPPFLDFALQNAKEIPFCLFAQASLPFLALLIEQSIDAKLYNFHSRNI